MKRPTFVHGICLAATLAFLASAATATLGPFLGFGTTLRFVIAMLGFTYVLYVLSRSTARVGRITTLSAWLVLAAASLWFAPSLPSYLLVHVAGLWLVRSLYLHSGVLSAAIDFGLCALSVFAAVWAMSRSGSVFMATWCFFLVQALFVAIPASIRGALRATATSSTDDDAFASARRQADEALRQLFTR